MLSGFCLGADGFRRGGFQRWTPAGFQVDFWTPQNPEKSTRDGWLTLCFIGVYCGLGWLLDSGWLPKKITLSLANLRA